MKLTSTIGGLAVLFAAVAAVSADDWPQWRGPNRTDISKEAGLLKDWPTDGLRKLWTYKNAGLGYAGVSIVGNRLYSMGVEGGNEFAFCLDTENGSKVWEMPGADRFKNRWGDGPRTTPTIDKDRVYCLFARGNLVCFNAADGKVIWQKSLESDFGGKTPFWGYSESPLIDGDKVVCTPGGGQGTMVALNKMTGEKVWQTEEITVPCHYSSIVKATIHDVPQYVQLTMNKIFGVRAEDGKVLWESEWPNGRTAVIPTPIVEGSRVYISSGYQAGSKLFEISKDWKTNDIWANKVMKNHHGGVIKIKDHLYGYSDGPGWTCQSFETGEMVWSTRKLGRRAVGKGAIAYADGHLYLITERKGEVVLIEASHEGFKEQSRFTLNPLSKRRSNQGGIWMHPVIANGKLYLRDQEFLSCFDVKGQ